MVVYLPVLPIVVVLCGVHVVSLRGCLLACIADCCCLVWWACLLVCVVVYLLVLPIVVVLCGEHVC